MYINICQFYYFYLLNGIYSFFLTISAEDKSVFFVQLIMGLIELPDDASNMTPGQGNSVGLQGQVSFHRPCSQTKWQHITAEIIMAILDDRSVIPAKEFKPFAESASGFIILELCVVVFTWKEKGSKVELSVIVSHAVTHAKYTCLLTPNLPFYPQIANHSVCS